jgi:sugar phosphate isomerase/epimerase
MIRLGCHSENFGILSPEETFSFISRLGFRGIDVAARSLAPQGQITEDPEGRAASLRALAETWGLVLDELFLGAVEAADGGVDPAAGEGAWDAGLYRRFERICRFARLAGFSSVMGAPGREDPARGWERSFENAAAVQAGLVKIAAAEGLAYHVEPSRNSLLNTPARALAMTAAVPGLKYTLDFLHFQISGTPLEESMALIPHAGHLHARQAARGTGKCDYAAGEIDYDAVVKELCRTGWQGGIAMEFWNGPEQDAAGINPVEQNIRMKYELKCLIRRYAGYAPD